MNKKDLSEREIITQLIIPVIKKADWNIEEQIREEGYFTDGRIYVKDNKYTTLHGSFIKRNELLEKLRQELINE